MRNFIAIIFLLLSSANLFAQNAEERVAWNKPVKPFRVAGNVYYVGAAGVSSFLITSPEGHILLDGGLPETAPLIQESIQELGFKLADVKILINSHAHFDHAGGLAELKKLTGAKLMISEGDAEQISRGGRGDFAWGDNYTYEPATVDRKLRDQDKIELGGVTMVARITPGHTKGCTTWTMSVREDGKDLNVVIIGSTTIPGYKLLGNPNYPRMAEDYAQSFALLRSLKCDVFLGPHPDFFLMHDKLSRIGTAKRNPFIDPAGYQRFLQRTETAYLQQLKEEQLKGNE